MERLRTGGLTGMERGRVGRRPQRTGGRDGRREGGLEEPKGREEPQRTGGREGGKEGGRTRGTQTTVGLREGGRELCDTLPPSQPSRLLEAERQLSSLPESQLDGHAAVVQEGARRHRSAAEADPECFGPGRSGSHEPGRAGSHEPGRAGSHR